MTKYNNWVKANKDCIVSQYWKDDYTFVRFAYDNVTGKGIEQVYILKEEYDINRLDELLEDAKKYAE